MQEWHGSAPEASCAVNRRKRELCGEPQEAQDVCCQTAPSRKGGPLDAPPFHPPGHMSKPLCAEAAELLENAPRLESSPYVVPPIFNPAQPMTDNTYSAGWRRILG